MPATRRSNSRCFGIWGGREATSLISPKSRNIVLALSLIALLALPAMGANPPGGRDYQSRMLYQVFIDGASCGMARAAGGGARFCSVVTDKAKSGVHPNKRAGQPACEDFVVDFNINLPPALLQWISATWDGAGQRKDVRVVCQDDTGTTLWDRTLQHSMVRQVVAPGLNLNEDSVPAFAISFAPTDIVENAGQQPAAGGNGLGGKDAVATLSYTLALDGINLGSLRSVEPVSVKLATVQVAAGQDKIQPTKATVTQVSDIAFTIGHSQAGALLTWARSCLGAGCAEKNGTLTCLDQRGQPVFTLKLYRCAVNRYEYAEEDNVPVVKASLYCEDVDLEMAQGGSTGSTGTPGAPTGLTAKPDAAPQTDITKKPATLPLTRSTGAAVGSPQKLGAFEFTLKKMEYSSSAMQVGGQQIALAPGQKLVVLRCSVRNASRDAVKLDEDSFSFTAKGSSGADYTDFAMGLGSGASKLQASLPPEDVLEFTAVAIVATEDNVTDVEITNTADGSKADYNTASAGKVAA